METISEEILLNRFKNKHSRNIDNNINIGLSVTEKKLPYTEDSYTVDAFEQYFKEKDSSNVFRFAFTINPICSNVLFNLVTEPVINEGAENCHAVLMNGALGNNREGLDSVFKEYLSGATKRGLYYGEDHRSRITREWFVRDTAFSHPEIYQKSAVTYHFGYDVFNNHRFRAKNFAIINKLNQNADATTQECFGFNTIADFKRDNNGKQIKDIPIRKNGNSNILRNEISLHLYNYDDLYSYTESIDNNLEEKNGWFGFTNKKSLSVKNLKVRDKNVSIDRIVNDEVGGAFVDMYPDRTLYSFKPKYNKHRHRYESNWDYCLTYPYSATTNNYLIYGNNVNGILCGLVTNIGELGITGTPSNIVFKSYIKHNLNQGDYVKLYFEYDGESESRCSNRAIRVNFVGNENGEDTEHYFSVSLSDVFNEISSVPNKESDISKVSSFSTPSAVRLVKNVNGNDCKYYLRIFKKIKDYSSSLNKLAFSQNAYADQIAQILFTEDVDVSGLRDNLNRPLSEIYLTIVKNNRGHEDWYEKNIFSSSTIEFSHCFGEVTSGFDLPTDEACKKYNVRRIHSIKDEYCGDAITKSPEKLETGITINSGLFYGDIVEYSPVYASETVIEDVYHRFNTAQRETGNSNYSGFTYDEINRDDFDLNEIAEYVKFDEFVSTFSAKDKIAGISGNAHINLFPEGYYYKPHYKVAIRSFENEVNEGQHTLVEYSSINLHPAGSDIEITAKENYYFNTGDTAYMYEKADGANYELKCTLKCVYAGETIGFLLTGGELPSQENQLRLFRKNPEMPESAHDIEDGSGTYVWRNVMSYSEMPTDNPLYNSQFTNGAHYFHENITFYLKRQDPNSSGNGTEYAIGGEPISMSEFIISNMSKNVKYAQSKTEFGIIKC